MFAIAHAHRCPFHQIAPVLAWQKYIGSSNEISKHCIIQKIRSTVNFQMGNTLVGTKYCVGVIVENTFLSYLTKYYIVIEINVA